MSSDSMGPWAHWVSPLGVGIGLNQWSQRSSIWLPPIKMAATPTHCLHQQGFDTSCDNDSLILPYLAPYLKTTVHIHRQHLCIHRNHWILAPGAWVQIPVLGPQFSRLYSGDNKGRRSRRVKHSCPVHRKPSTSTDGCCGFSQHPSVARPSALRPRHSPGTPLLPPLS